MWEYFRIHTGKVIAIIAGLFFSIIYLFFGFFDMLVVLIIMIIAYYIGTKRDRKESIRESLLRYLPDNFFDRDHH